MSSLSKDLNISNNQSPSKPLSKNSVLSRPFSNVESDIKAKGSSVSRKKMISDIKDYKKDLSEKSNFKRGSAYNMTNLFLKLCNLNFTIANIRSMSDEELLAIWSDIKSSK